MSLDLRNMDCMELMREYPDNHFELAIVDPPYGINTYKQRMGDRKTVATTEKTWDSAVPDESYFNELFRVSKNQIIWGGNYFVLPPSRYFAIWDKGETLYGRSYAECEFAWVRFGGTRIKKINPLQLDRFHPTQKPIELYKWLLHRYAKQGDKILDTHLGSGSIAIACHQMNFDLTGSELDKEYFEAMQKRIKEETAQKDLFR